MWNIRKIWTGSQLPNWLTSSGRSNGMRLMLCLESNQRKHQKWSNKCVFQMAKQQMKSWRWANLSQHLLKFPYSDWSESLKYSVDSKIFRFFQRSTSPSDTEFQAMLTQNAEVLRVLLDLRANPNVILGVVSCCFYIVYIYILYIYILYCTIPKKDRTVKSESKLGIYIYICFLSF